MATAPEILPYAFEQLDSSVAGHVGGAADVLTTAYAEAEQVRAQARQDGEAAGRAEGLAAARAEAAPALQAVGEAIGAIESLRDELVTSLESQAAELAIRLAEQIVSAAIEVEPERVLDVARGALRRLADRHRVTLLVNPADLQLLTDSVDELQAGLGGVDHLDVQADRRIERGGAIARTDSGEIDVTIGAQLQSARELIVAALRGGEDEADEGDGELEQPYAA
jgi:flagellar assembly protein FliH